MGHSKEERLEKKTGGISTMVKPGNTILNAYIPRWTRTLH